MLAAWWLAHPKENRPAWAMWPGWVRVPLPSFVPRVKRPTTIWGAFALGAVFSTAVCPVCTPALVISLVAAAAIQSPLLAPCCRLLSTWAAPSRCAWAAGWLEKLGILSKYQKGFEIAGAVTLIASGLYLLNAYYFWIPSLAM